MSDSSLSETVPGTYDHCVNTFATNSLLGAGVGLAVAFLLSAKRHAWLSGMVYGSGVGGGFSYLQCKEVMDRLYAKTPLRAAAEAERK